MPRLSSLPKLAAAFLFLALAACNTVQGVGQDIESVGKAGEEAMD